jgi:DNA replication protein DnaC
MKAATQILLKENLKALNLSHMFTSLGSLVRQAGENGTGYEEFLLALTEVELQIRAENRLKRKLREAKFPLLKTLEQFDYGSAEVLDKRLMRELEAGDYLHSHRNIILTGKSGTGKTHLATGLAVAACRQGINTRFVNGCGLSMELIEAQSERRLSRVIQKYARYGLVVVDELGYVPFSKESAELLFQVLAERHERGSVIITTNLGFADWTQVFGDATLTATLLDRLTHKAHIINCTWESYRLKETLKARRESSKTSKTTER